MFGNNLVVRTNAQAHEQIAELLKALQAANGCPFGDGRSDLDSARCSEDRIAADSRKATARVRH